MKIYLLSIWFILVMLAACSPQQDPALHNNDPEVNQFKKDLKSLIGRADRIVVTEHSNQFDFWNENMKESDIPAPITYQTIALNKKQILLLHEMADSLGGDALGAPPACIFEPHHTITFFAKGSQISAMVICFECSQIQWDGTKSQPPQMLHRALAGFIKEIGLEPNRDWRSLAQKTQNKKGT